MWWDERRNKKSLNFFGIYCINMVDIRRKTYETNGVETIVDNDGILWLNEKYLDGLNHKRLQEITT